MLILFYSIISDSFCPPLDPPEGGSQQCEDWGPGGRFKVCRVQCDEGLRFSQQVPQFYTCGAEGFWRPNPSSDLDPTAPFTYPACSEARPAQKIFKIKLDYLTDVLCNDAGKGVLKQRIISALQDLNKEWNFSSCNRLTEEDCKDLGININCNRRPAKSDGSSSSGLTRIRRQIGSQSGSGQDQDQAYSIEFSVPTKDTDEVTNEAGFRESIERLIEKVILEENRLDVNDTLPNVLLDKSSIAIDKEFTCQDGEVVRENECGECLMLR